MGYQVARGREYIGIMNILMHQFYRRRKKRISRAGPIYRLRLLSVNQSFGLQVFGNVLELLCKTGFWRRCEFLCVDITIHAEFDKDTQQYADGVRCPFNVQASQFHLDITNAGVCYIQYAIAWN